MNENNALLKNTGLIAIGNLGAKVITFVLLPLYTSILSTEEYGIYDFVIAVCAYLYPVVTLSMNEALFRFVIDGGDDEENFKRVVSHALFIQIAGVLVLGVIISGISLVYSPEICMSIWLYACSSSLFGFSTYMLRGMGKTKTYATVSLAKTTLQLTFNILAVVVFRCGVRGLLFSLYVSETLAFVYVFLTNKLWQQISLRVLSKAQAGRMLKYSLPLVPNALCGQIVNLSDRIIISGFLGAGANGIYAVSCKFPNIIETVYHYFYLAWSESASRVIEKGKEYAHKYYQDLHDMLDNLVFSVVLCMISAMPILFRFFVKGDYIAGFDYIPLLVLAMYFSSMGRFYAGIYTALKRTGTLATSTMIGAGVSICMNLLMISWLGLYAAAISNLLAHGTVLLVRKLRLRKDMVIHTNWKGMAVKAVMSIIVLLLYSYDNWLFTGLSILCVAVYSVIANRVILKTIIKKLFKR